MEIKTGVIIKPKARQTTVQEDLFRSQLCNIINMRHELVKLGDVIDWAYLESKVSNFYAEVGRPGTSTRLIVGLHILKQIYHLSDEGVCERWVHDVNYHPNPSTGCHLNQAISKSLN